MQWIRRNVSAREFAFWRRYRLQRPMDDESSVHLPIAQLCLLYANYHRAEGAPPRRLTDFMPFRARESQGEDLEDQLRRGEW